MEKKQIKEILREKIQQTNHHPFLFVGSGFSRRYMNTENWSDLLRYLCSLCSNNPLQYSYYSSKCKATDYYGKQPQIAEMLEHDFSEAVFTQPAFADFRTRNMTLLSENISPLKIAIAEHIQEFAMPSEPSDELELLKKIAVRSVSGIITTNYDKLLEHFFPTFKTYTGQEELLFANPSEIGEIYKIHGSIDKPDSIVITSSDYRRFESLSAYLIAKILTIFIEYPIIFLGYSISDKNIQNILETISTCLSQDKLNILKDRFIFIDYSDDNTISNRTFQFGNGHSISMTQVSTKDYLPVYEAIYEVKSTYNPVVLRALRQDIYNLARENNPHGNIVATGFETLEQIKPNTNIILGVGVARNGHLLKAEQLYEDVVRDNQYLDPKLVVEEYLPELLKRNTGGLPMFKYLQEYQGELFENIKMQIVQHTSIESFLNKSLKKSKKNYRTSLSEKTVQNIISIEGKENAYKKLIFLEATEIDLPSLHKYLSHRLGESPQKTLKNNSELKRLIRIYDFLKYSKTASAHIDQ